MGFLITLHFQSGRRNKVEFPKSVLLSNGQNVFIYLFIHKNNQLFTQVQNILDHLFLVEFLVYLFPRLRTSICNCKQKPEHICIILGFSQDRILHCLLLQIIIQSTKNCSYFQILTPDDGIYYWSDIVFKTPSVPNGKVEKFMRCSEVFKILYINTVFFTN